MRTRTHGLRDDKRMPKSFLCCDPFVRIEVKKTTKKIQRFLAGTGDQIIQRLFRSTDTSNAKQADENWQGNYPEAALSRTLGP